uniref:Uncharacterized protein n=2 Tax=Triticum urartu TaxID=4572 RepID=A0A8R7JZE8_TRIUA
LLVLQTRSPLAHLPVARRRRRRSDPVFARGLRPPLLLQAPLDAILRIIDQDPGRRRHSLLLHSCIYPGIQEASPGLLCAGFRQVCDQAEEPWHRLVREDATRWPRAPGVLPRPGRESNFQWRKMASAFLVATVSPIDCSSVIDE